MYEIESKVHKGRMFAGCPAWNNTNSQYKADHIKNEPMFFNSDLKYAFKNGGPITRNFIQTFLTDIKNPRLDIIEGLRCPDWAIVDGEIDFAKYVIDTKVAMLMPGWYPCIPGFHHDDVPRDREDGQPEYENPSYRSKHVMAICGDPIANTEYAVGTAYFDHVDGIVYKTWHNRVEEYIASKQLYIRTVKLDQLYYFDDRAWHRGVAATGNGWRWFGRISWDTARVDNISNEIRRQAQVYLENPMEGW